MDHFCPFRLTSFFELPCTSVESYARLYVKKQAFHFFRIMRRPHVPCMIPGTGTRYQVFIASSRSQQVPRSYCCTKRVTPIESSHGHHLPTHAASARAARGRCFDPKRAATAPGCRACSESLAHRVWLSSWARLSSGSQQQQYSTSIPISVYELTTRRRQVLTRWLTSTASSRPDAVDFLAEGRASVGLYATDSVCVCSS